MPINGEPFLRGVTIEHRSGAKYAYEGRVKRSNMWGASSDHDAFHVLATLTGGDLYLEPESVFFKNYREPGTWQEPDAGQTWRHQGTTRTVTIRRIVDDLVVYDYQNDTEVHTGVYYARLTDEFLKEFRYGTG